MPAASGPGWTDERVTALKALWAKDLSATQIAKALGHVTRNAVIGKAGRIGLPPRGPETARLNQVDAQQRRHAAASSRYGRPQPANHPFKGPGAPKAPIDVRKLREAVVVDIRPATLVDLPAHCCKWPLPGQDIPLGGGAAMLFCGAAVDTELEKIPSYCPGHVALAYQPPSNKVSAAPAVSRAGQKRSVFGSGRGA